MANAGGGKDFLLEKGEKVGLGVAGALGVLFLALGLMGMADRPQDPAEFQKAMDGKASLLNSTMNSPTATVEDDKSNIDKAVANNPVMVLKTEVPFFDNTTPPDGRRTSPNILAVVEAQADVSAVKIPATDIELERDASTGEVIRIRVGVIGTKEKEKAEGSDKFLQSVKNALGKIPRYQPRQGGSGPGGPMGAGFMGGGPGGPMGAGFMGGAGPMGMGGVGGPMGAGFMGGGGGPVGPMGPGGGGMGGGKQGGGGTSQFGPGMGGGQQEAGQRLEVQYIEGATDEEIDKQMNGRRLAITIQPQRMAVIQASFPYRAQIQQYVRALKYADAKQLYAVPDDMPTFHGVDVQRKTYRPRGRDVEMLEDWTTINLAENSQQLRAITISYDEDPIELKRVMLHEDHLLAMPLPHPYQPNGGKYPELRLKSLKDAIAKQKALDPKATAPVAPKSKYTGEGNPFKKEQGAQSNFFGGSENTGVFGQPPRGGKGSNDPAPATTTQNGPEPPDFIYVRVYDNDVKEGLVYEYRLRVKLKNPNFKRPADQVARASDADNEEMPPLDEHWFQVPDRVAIPQSAYHYVIDAKKPDPKDVSPLPPLREGQAVVQFQRWYNQLAVGGGKHTEPIGDWVLADLIVTRGQYVSGKAFAPVPLWSSEANEFQMRGIPGEKAPPRPKGSRDPAPEQRKGVIVEPSRSKELLVVDVSGGKTRVRVPQTNPGENRAIRGAETVDESATEVLFLLADGTLDVRSSAIDRADEVRKGREETFKKWKEDTEKKMGTTPTGPKGGTGGKGDDF